MDPRDNPYTPNAGARPPALVGRDPELEAFDVLLHRLERGTPQQSMIVTGLRGVGKTVLLGAFRDIALGRRWGVVEDEASRNDGFAARIAAGSRKALLALSPRAAWKGRVRDAAGVLKSLTITYGVDGSVSAGLDVDPRRGQADSGLLAEDLTDLFVALGEAAREAGAGVVLLLDEIQYLSADQFEALIQALHKTVQRSLPITMVGAGLPQMPRIAGEAKTYAERLFRFPRIGPLGLEARRALEAPAEPFGVTFEATAVSFVVRFTEGYPYFIQEFGNVVWDRAAGPVIGLADAKEAVGLVEARLDESFFRVRAERSNASELQYLRAMAELGSGAQKAADVASMLGKTSSRLGPVRSKLIEKGLLYSPDYGLAAFTVPQFDKFMKRSYPLDTGSSGTE